MRRDCLTPEARFRAMRSNRGRTRPELALARRLWHQGFRYWTADGYRRRTGRRFFGNPDLIFAKRRVVVFVDGCFWHGCKRCHDFKRDLNAWWRAKIAGNVLRDRRIRCRLRRQGWIVLVVREHDLKTAARFDGAVVRLTSRIPPIR